MRKGSKHLKIASILVILLGVISILAVQLLLGTSESAGNYSEDVLKGALGFLIFIAQLAAFFQSGNGISEIVVNIILLAIPYYYLHNAYKNYKD